MTYDLEIVIPVFREEHNISETLSNIKKNIDLKKG